MTKPCFMNNFNPPKNTKTISWTKHCIQKMKFYGLSPQRVLRILRNPNRCQEAVAPGCVACMQTVGNKRKTEIWMMYQEKIQNSTPRPRDEIRNKILNTDNHKKIITAWRYPGISPVKDEIPIPKDIMEEISNLDNL